jgi:hypothetical protein
MLSPEQPVRRDVRYAFHLPVSVRLEDGEMHAQSENISLHGILLASTFLIPQGSTVELAIAVGRMPNPAVF